MLKLSIIQAVGATVGQDGSSPIAERILKPWGFDRGSVRSVRFSSNCVFTFSQNGIRRYLRFVPDWEQRRDYIEAETTIVRGLQKAGIRAAQPIPSLFGNDVETVETEIGQCHAVVFTALGGRHLGIDELDEAKFRTWGSALGELHAAMKAYGTTGAPRPSYREHLKFIGESVASDDAIVRSELEAIAAWAEALERNGGNFGLVHFDFELDNLCWHDGVLESLDFDDCAYHWYAADIAYALEDLFEDGVDHADRRFKAFLAGYREQFAIDEQSLEHLPGFLRLGNLYGYALRARSVDLSIDETATWLRHLHKKFTESMNAYRSTLESG